MLPLEISIAPKLKAIGFLKKARTWRRTAGDCIQVINVQKSPYGEQIYLNLAVYVRSLGSESSPAQHRCHIQARLEQIVPEPLFGPVARATSTAELSAALLEALLVHGIDWLDALASATGRRSFLQQPTSSRCFIDARARTA
jgi:hypothetical protein